ncbi:MAG: FKBP-type peptidyl-prolyl cis-trans isomerase [Euryarchaeota archaeon]|nr:FKBP-type peptidyl-prolyl cis-trans isomerase [Euryarchaeota archaeon]
MPSKKTLEPKKNTTGIAIAAVLIVIIALIIALLSIVVLPSLLQPNTIEVGDCIEVEYIGKFTVNGTVFTTTYNDSVNKTGGTPQKLFVNPNMNLSIPRGYETYTSAPTFVPQKAIRSLIGMKEGETKNITLSPEETYGRWDMSLAEQDLGGIYPINTVLSFTETNISESDFSNSFPEVNIAVNTTFDFGALNLRKEGVLSAKITNISDDRMITIRLLPENGKTFVIPDYNWNATFIVTNDTMFTIHSDVKLNHTFSFEDYDQTYYCKVIAVNENEATLGINVFAPSIEFVDQSLSFEFKVIKITKTSHKES